MSISFRSGASASVLVLSFLAAGVAQASEPAQSAMHVAHDVVQVDQVVVTASAFERKVADAPASVTVIGREALVTKRFSSLAEALADVEGVDVGDGVGKTGGLNISIRGMPSDYTLVLVDGRRQNAAGNVTPNGFGETSTSFMPPTSAIERIEVVRGPMSTLYGSDAMGGVVNIITRRIGERWRAAATVQGTLLSDDQFGATYGAEAYVDGPIVADRLGLALRGSVFKREASELSYVNANGQPVEVSRRGPSPVEADIWTLGGRLSVAPAANHDLWLDVDVAEQAYDNSESQLGTGTIQGGYDPELRFEREQYGLAHDWRSSIGLITSDLARNVTTTIGRTIPPGTPGKTAGDPAPWKQPTRSSTPGSPPRLAVMPSPWAGSGGRPRWSMGWPLTATNIRSGPSSRRMNGDLRTISPSRSAFATTTTPRSAVRPARGPTSSGRPMRPGPSRVG